ncbi:MAG: phosphoribosyltransferase family protein [Candidatus Paceibacterota bacterium]|jgi:putative phosphoribosyl transferase
MTPFRDRTDAGKHLAKKLSAYAHHPDAIVIAPPNGGVAVGAEIARRLGLPLDIITPRKIPEERRKQWSVGAVTETGTVIWDTAHAKLESGHYLRNAVRLRAADARRRLARFRGRGYRRDVKGKTVILVDDGVARGWTLAAAAKTLRAEGASRIIIAVPICSRTGRRLLRRLSDHMLCIHMPPRFRSVGRFYHPDGFNSISDDDVRRFLRRSRQP